MGLLDDAIREHLEIKRLRGVDPGEVARAEEEALGAVHRGQDFGADSSTDSHTEGPLGEGEAPSEEDAPPVEDSPTVTASSASGGPAPTGQETAELDMRTVLATGGTAGEAPAGDSLEWEVPSQTSGESREAAHEGGEETGTAAPLEGVEDVLEETPDFLRETPDQERLWFEQQPPRDFDFDK
jgi:hypothetical protein